jgi:hypothetical protein
MRTLSSAGRKPGEANDALPAPGRDYCVLRSKTDLMQERNHSNTLLYAAAADQKSRRQALMLELRERQTRGPP